MMRIARRRDRRMLERALGGATIVAVVAESESAAVAAMVEPMAPVVGLVDLEGRYLLVDYSTATKATKRRVLASHAKWKAVHRAA